MKSFQDFRFGLYIMICFLTGNTNSLRGTCPPPDVPDNGDYQPKQSVFQLGNEITYNCSDGYILTGEKECKCSSDALWSVPVPFCDPKVEIKEMILSSKTNEIRTTLVSDKNVSTCIQLDTKKSLKVTLEKGVILRAVKIYLQVDAGPKKIEVSVKDAKCKDQEISRKVNDWVVIRCNKNELADILMIQLLPNTGKSSGFSRDPYCDVCELEVYAKEGNDCDEPPKLKIANAHFIVNRSIARLICKDGYKSEVDRFVCENKAWAGNYLHCHEILCDPKVYPQEWWKVIDPVKQVTEGTRMMIECKTGFEIVGVPDTIKCQKDGNWTFTNATCVSRKERGKFGLRGVTRAIIAVVSIVVIVLLGAILYFIIKKREKQTVVLCQSPVDGHTCVPGSDYSSPYYESVKYDEPPLATDLLFESGPRVGSNEYILPIDCVEIENQRNPEVVTYNIMKDSPSYGY